MMKSIVIWLLATAIADFYPRLPTRSSLEKSSASVSWIQALLLVARSSWRRSGKSLNKLGWIEGKNITIEYRFAEQKPERLPELAAEPGSS